MNIPHIPRTHTANELPAFEYDRKAVNSFRLFLGTDKNKLPLQLPPRILSENKTNKWHTTHHMGFEPFAWWQGADARNIQIEFDYVVWGSWSIDIIQKTIRQLKLFFYVGGPGISMQQGFAEAKKEIQQIREDNTYVENDDKMPLIRIGGWDIIATEGLPTFRVDGVNFQYSPERVGSGSKWWPLKTTVKMACHLWTRTGWLPFNPSTSEGNSESDGKNLNHGPIGVLQPGWV